MPSQPRRPDKHTSPLGGEAESRSGREGGTGAHLGHAGAGTPLSNAPPQGGRGPVGASPATRQSGEHTSARLVLLGEFGRAHGLKGEVRLKSFTEDPRAIARYSPLQGEDGRSFALKGVRPAGGGSPDLVIARVEGVATREAAESLNRVRLYAPRERLQGAEGDDEFLLADLIGLAVRDTDGRALGAVAAVPNYGGGDLLEITPEGGGATALLPFTEAFVPDVRVMDGYVVVDAPDLFSGKADEDA